MMMSWIDNNAIVGQEIDVPDLKKELMKQFKCEDCGPMNEYIGCAIETRKSGGIKFPQKVLLQSYRGEFDIKNLMKFKPRWHLELFSRYQSMEMCFLCQRDRCCIVLVWGRQCT